nr:hypothetical protein [Tanacetum cinerariifolium]
MNKKINTWAERQADNKRKSDDTTRNNHQQPNKRQNTRRAYAVGNGDIRAYKGPRPLCTKCNYHQDGPCAPKCHKCNRFDHLSRDYRNPPNVNTGANQRGNVCFEYGSQGHFKKECPKLKNKKQPGEDFLEDLFPKQPSGNPTFSPHPELTSPEVNNNIYDSEGCNVLSEKLPDIDSINDIHPYFDDNPLSGSTTYFSNSLLEEFTDEIILITYPLEYDDNLQFDIESDLKEIEFLLYHGKDSCLKDSIDQTDLANLDNYFVDPIPEMFIDEHTPDYSSPPIFDVYDDDFLEVESDAENVYDDPFDSKGEKIKESKLLIDKLDLPCDFLPYSEYYSFNS